VIKKFKKNSKIFFEKNRLFVGLIIICFILMGGGSLMAKGAEADSSKTITQSDLQQQDAELTKETKGEDPEIVFDIEGGVVNAGVYRLKAGSVMVDAIEAAGGFSIDADKERIAHELNQAAVIGNNAKLYIFKNSDKDAKVVTSGMAQTSSSNSDPTNSNKVGTKININSADLTALDALPGIGPAIGQRIIDWRETNGGFEVIEDIKKVKGIGDSLYEGIKDQIVVE
jgi:competence protein ComEA